MTTFVSRLGPSMSDFLDYKHALGIKYTSASVYLRELDRYNAAHGDHHEYSGLKRPGYRGSGTIVPQQ